MFINGYERYIKFPIKKQCAKTSNFGTKTVLRKIIVET